METSVLRGFSNSFLPNCKMEVKDLQYIEGAELERTWKMARRQRLKQQEDKIWEDFVKEQDVIKSVYSEDPYQFLEQLPESCIKELIDSELQRPKIEKETPTEQEQKRGAGDSPRLQDSQHTVTFAELDQDDIFHIFEDEKDDDVSGEDDLDPMESPCTVRVNEVMSEPEVPSAPTPPVTESVPHQPATKSSENVTNVIQSSIYCAKVKDLRMKINEEIHDIITSLDRVNLACVDPSQLRKMGQRSAEFCSRFQRIHLYQLQRQLSDIKRHNAQALPFAKYTQFQSQMDRIVSVHHNMLQSLQVFHRSFELTLCLCESAAQLKALGEIIRAINEECLQCSVPQDFTAAKELYNDEILSTVEKLDKSIKNYVTRSQEIILAADTNAIARPHKKVKNKKQWVQVKATKNKEPNSLSMYSFETLRFNQPGKTHSSKEMGVKPKRKLISRKRETPPSDSNVPKSVRKTTPRLRRPLMRDPSTTAPPRRREPETIIHTMVENVDAHSSHISSETTPRPRRSPRNSYVKPTLSSIRSETIETSSAAKSITGPGLEESKSEQAEMETATIVSSFVTDLNTPRDKSPPLTPISVRKPKNEKSRPQNTEKLLRQLCGGDNISQSPKADRTSSKNAQLLCLKETPVQPSTPQLLKILEQTIQKKSPRQPLNPGALNAERLRLAFNIPQHTADSLFQYRTKFVQYMLSSSLYANSVVGKPWETIGSIAERLIEEVLMKCAKEMEIQKVLLDILRFEMAE